MLAMEVVAQSYDTITDMCTLPKSWMEEVDKNAEARKKSLEEYHAEREKNVERLIFKAEELQKRHREMSCAFGSLMLLFCGFYLLNITCLGYGVMLIVNSRASALKVQNVDATLTTKLF